jgi:hypothetical protein
MTGRISLRKLDMLSIASVPDPNIRMWDGYYVVHQDHLSIAVRILLAFQNFHARRDMAVPATV